jgi:hypothetical protein
MSRVQLSLSLETDEAQCLALALRRVHRQQLRAAMLTPLRHAEENARLADALSAIALALRTKGYE